MKQHLFNDMRSTDMHQPPAHKQTDPAKLPGQIVNPINTDMHDDMSDYATRVTWNDPKPLMGNTESAPGYKPAHGGYPGTVVVR